MRLRGPLLLPLLLGFLMPVAAQYTARRQSVKGVNVIQLRQRRPAVTVSIAPSIGNIAYEMVVNGQNVFWFPFSSVAEFEKKPALCGNPLLAPWANRLDENAFYADSKKYLLNPGLGNLRLDAFQHPIHGLLLFASDWQVVELEANAGGAWVTSQLDFSRRPEWLAQFPFAHTVYMTYALHDGALEVTTRVKNRSTATMPLSLGYHPYFQVHDARRDAWTVGLGATTEWLLDKELLPTGATRPIRELAPTPQKLALRGRALDNVFGELVRDAGGRATFWVQGKQQKIEVSYGPRYQAAVVYAPTGENRNFICFEPMTGITNAFNLAHRGLYKALQTIPPGQSWQESFWIKPSGF